MSIFEFDTTIDGKTIEIPNELLGKSGKKVHIILSIDEQKNKKDEFLDKYVQNPIKVEGFVPFKRDEIYE